MGPRNNEARQGDTRPFFLALKYFQAPATPGGGGTPHMKGVGMLVGNFEWNP